MSVNKLKFVFTEPLRCVYMRCTFDLEVSCMTSLVMHFLTSHHCQHCVYYSLVNVCCQSFHLPFLVCFPVWLFVMYAHFILKHLQRKSTFFQCFLCPPHIVTMNKKLESSPSFKKTRYFKSEIPMFMKNTCLDNNILYIIIIFIM